MRRELGGRIAKALDKLTPRERMVFEMKHYQGLKLRTIWRDFEYDRRNGEKYAVPRHAETARRLERHEVIAMLDTRPYLRNFELNGKG